MKHLALILALVGILACYAPDAAAQNNKRSQWTTEMLQAKHDLIVKETDMTKAQQDKFMPLYTAMEQEIYQVNKEARALADKVNKTAKPTNEQYAQAAAALSGVKAKEGQIEAKYFQKFAQILSKKQLFQLKQAELKFTRSMLSKGKTK